MEDGQFDKLDVEDMTNQAGQFTKKIGKLKREIARWDVWELMQKTVREFVDTMPLITDLKNPALRERHWNDLKAELHKDFDQTSVDFTLEKVFAIGLATVADFIGELSGNANKELAIETALEAIEGRWVDIIIDAAEYKEVYFKIKSTDDLYQVLEDDAVSLSTMKASKFYGSFKSKIDFWESGLSLVSEVVDMLLTVQRKWMYLESIFMAAGDINKQLPEESALFSEVNDTFKAIMSSIADDPNAIRQCKKPGMLDRVGAMDAKLERIQKSLDRHLETKRMAFPRFYFVSTTTARDPRPVARPDGGAAPRVQELRGLREDGRHPAGQADEPQLRVLRHGLARGRDGRVRRERRARRRGRDLARRAREGDVPRHAEAARRRDRGLPWQEGEVDSRLAGPAAHHDGRDPVDNGLHEGARRDLGRLEERDEADQEETDRFPQPHG